MKNQFNYFTTRKDEKGVEKQCRDSFNMNKVIRAVTQPDETVIVILDDFNERVTDQPNFDTKRNKITGYKKVRETVQSEILLSKEDGERFYKLTNIE
jgi:hypothetical protein